MLAIFLMLLLITLDQVSKRLAYTLLQPIGTVPLTPFFSLTYVENRGAAFGILYGARWFFVMFTVAVLGALLFYYRHLPAHRLRHWTRLSIVLLSAGAIGNFIDRLLFGFVIDFFHVTAFNFPVFNVADILIVVGALLFSLMTILTDEKKPTPPK